MVQGDASKLTDGESVESGTALNLIKSSGDSLIKNTGHGVRRCGRFYIVCLKMRRVILIHNPEQFQDTRVVMRPSC